MIIEMIMRDIGKNPTGKANTFYPALMNSVRAHFHEYMCATSAASCRAGDALK
jgi:hypothetical protein